MTSTQSTTHEKTKESPVYPALDDTTSDAQLAVTRRVPRSRFAEFGATIRRTPEPWKSALFVLVVAVVVRALLLAASTSPLFMSGTGTYLRAAHDFWLPSDRPAGVSVFFRAVLEVRHSLTAIVLAHAALGAVSAALTAVIACQCGIRPLYSRIAGTIFALSPSILVYERTILAETLTVAFTIAATAVYISGLSPGRNGRLIAASFLAGSTALIRTTSSVFVFSLLFLALSAPTHSVRRILNIAVMTICWGLLPMALYSSLFFVDSKARTGDGTFTMTNFDGISLFARNARFLDCSDPTRSPAMRLELCNAGPEYLDGGVDSLWAPGPMVDSVFAPDAARRNEEMRELAIEGMRAHPWAVARESLSVAWSDLTAQDIRYPTRANDIGPPAEVVRLYFGEAVADRADENFGNRLQDVNDVWARMRPVIWICSAAAAISLSFRGNHRSRLGLLAAGGVFLPLIPLALAGAPSPRYMLPSEFIGLICLAWVLQSVIPMTRDWLQNVRAERLEPTPHQT
jgi:hypothetical protein